MADNPWVTAAASSGEAPANPWANAASAGGNPWGNAAHAVTSAGGAVLERLGVPRIIDLLDKQRQMTQSAIAGHGLQGADHDQQDANRAAVRHKLGLDEDYSNPRLFKGGPVMPPALVHANQGLIDFGVDTITDPVTLETLGIGALAKGAGRLLGTAGGAIAKAAPGLASEAGEYAHAIGDFFTHGGPAKRALGADTYHGAIAADNRQAAREAEAARRLQVRFDATLAHLPDDERLQVYQVLNGERDTRGMPQHVAEAARNARQLLNDAGAMYATDTGRRKLAYGGGRLAQADVRFRQRGPVAVPDDGFGGALNDLIDASRSSPRGAGPGRWNGRNAIGMAHPDDVRPRGQRRLVGRVDRPYALPEDLREFAAPADQGLLGAENIRQNYLPGPKTGEDLVGEDVRPGSYNLLKPFAPNTLQRKEFTTGEADLGALDEAFRGSLAQAARQGTAGRMREELGVGLGGNNNADLINLFERQPKAKGAARTTGEKALDRWKSLVEIPKNVVTVLGGKHGLINVPDLANRSEGLGAALEAYAQGFATTLRSPEARYDFLKPASEGGTIAPFSERENPIADLLTKLPGPLGKAAGGATKYVNDLTWSIDDAAKRAVQKRKFIRLRQQGVPYREALDRSAAETLRDMVDYRHTSQATKIAKNVAPFATFRMGLPAAVLGSTLRNPKRALAIDRASSGLGSNGRVDVDGHRVTLTTPGSDVLDELLDEPQAYLRAMLGDPVKLAASGLAPGVKIPGRRWPSKDADAGTKAEGPTWRDDDRYFTAGKPVLPYRDSQGGWHMGAGAQTLSGYTPLGIGEKISNAAGIGDFSGEDWLSMLLGYPFGLHVR